MKSKAVRLVAIVMVLTLSACTSDAVSIPSYPIPTGVSNCGGFAVAGNAEQWISLSSCAGMVGIDPAPEIETRVGERVFVESATGTPLEPFVLTASPSDLVIIDGLDMTALRPGTTVITGRGALPCLPDSHGPDASCPLMRVTIR